MRTAWAVWSVPELTQRLTLLLTALYTDDDAMHNIDRFIILLCDRTRTTTDIDKACRELLAKKSNV